MTINAAEIESIVRQVLKRTREMGASASFEITGDHPVGCSQGDEVNLLSESVVTLETIQPLFGSCNAVAVSATTVVTPAAKDELRRRGVALHRASKAPAATDSAKAQGSSTAGKATKMFLLGPKSKVLHASSLGEDLPIHAIASCGQPEQEVIGITKVLNTSDARVLWCSALPYAATAAASKCGGMSAIYLPSLTDFAAAIAQAQFDVLVLDDRNWSAASLARLARNWMRSVS